MNIKENFEINEIKYLEELNKSGYKQVYTKYSYEEDGETKVGISTRRCYTTSNEAIFYLNNTKYVCDVDTLMIKSKHRIDDYNSKSNNINLNDVKLDVSVPNFCMNNDIKDDDRINNNYACNDISNANVNANEINNGGVNNEEESEENKQNINEGNGESNSGTEIIEPEEENGNKSFFPITVNIEEDNENNDEETQKKQDTQEPKKIVHSEYDTIKECIDKNIPVYLSGPAGSGKNYTIKKIAEELGLDFYFTNSVQQEYKITGFIDAGGTFHETEFYKAFKDGGLFFLDEMDASIPEVLVLLNAAIANKYFEFPNGRIDAHEEFRVVAAGNTIGKGADEMYTGRTILDGATLDRFVNIKFDYDENVEMMLAENDKALINFIHDLRESCAKYDIQAIFSYRCIEHVVKLKKSLPLEKVLEIAVFKSMSVDDMKMFNLKHENKYTRALSKVIETMSEK